MASEEYSPWTIAQSQQPKWRPGEELAASAFLGMVFLYFVDINMSIIRVFKKKKGLYFWSLILATWGCLIDAIGVVCKYLIPNSSYLYGFYTICMLGGWTIFAPMQLLVLYSRLHLVNDNRKIQRWVLIMILSTLFTVILPTWVVVWPAYNPDPSISSVWSPRDAIVERYTQIVLTLVECFISGVYIWSLLGLMHYKSSLRQRRVMLDLIYVNVICVAFDILNLLLIYLNQLGLSHPIQVFGYILKLKLEFVVLNQLMAVAARGIQKQTFAERRYYKPTLQDTFAAEAKDPDSKPSKTTTNGLFADPISPTNTGPRPSDSSADSHIAAPSPTHQPTNRKSRTPGKTSMNKASPDRLAEEVTDLNDPELSNQTTGPELEEYVEKAETADEQPLTPPRRDTGSDAESDATRGIRPTFSSATLDANASRGDDTRISTEHPSKPRSALHSFLHPFSHHHHQDQDQIALSTPHQRETRNQDEEYQQRLHRQQSLMGGHEAAENALRRRGIQQANSSPIKATLRRHRPYRKSDGDGNEEEEEEGEEIGVHMWERPGPKGREREVVLEVPWFKSRVEA